MQTELLRVTTRHPATALLEIVRERNAGLLVFGPHLNRKLRFRRVARRLRAAALRAVWTRERAHCDLGRARDACRRPTPPMGSPYPSRAPLVPILHMR